MGGAETSLYYLVKGINKDKYIPFVLCPVAGSLVDRLTNLNIPTRIIPLPPWRKAKSILSRSYYLHRLIDFAEEAGFDLIHSNTIWVNHYAQKTAKAIRIPLVCHLRDIIKVAQVTKYGLHRADMIIPISDAVREPLNDAGIEPSRIQRIYNGVDLQSFSCGKDALKSVHNINGYLVGIVGQMSPRSHWKGQSDFIRAAAEVNRKMDNVYFAVIGGDDSPLSDPKHGSYVRELKELVKSLDIESKFIFTGNRKDMPDVMASLDILVSASHAEPFGRVIIEAMAAGKPVIATMAGGAPEIVQDGITGILVPTKDYQSISKSIIYILEDDKCQRMGQAGKKRAKECFSIDQNIREIQLVYDGLLNKG